MKLVSYLLITVAFVVTAVALWPRPTTYGAFSSAALAMFWWPLSPYLLIALLVWAVRSKAATTGVLVVCVVASVLGAVTVIDLIYIHADALNGMIVMMVPLVQWGLLVVIGLSLLISLNRIKSA